tara:strand:- start:89 stop:391 length:303 start_codon:yes stop_codon:yes gene_type:complete
MQIIEIETQELICESDEEKKICKQHDRDFEDKKYNDTWESCCLIIDRRAAMYFSQLGVMCIVMIFSIYQLISLEDCNSQATYLGLVSMLIGLILPNPKFN